LGFLAKFVSFKIFSGSFCSKDQKKTFDGNNWVARVFSIVGFAALKKPCFLGSLKCGMRGIKINIVLRQIFNTINLVVHELIFFRRLEMTEIPPPDNSWQICPKCNSPIIHGTKFCESCGSPLSEVFLEKQPAAPAENILPMPEAQDTVTGILPPESTIMESSIPPTSDEAPEKADEKTTPELQPAPAPVPTAVQGTTKPPEDLPSSPVPGPKKPLPAMTLAMIGIVILIVMALLAYVVVLPMLSGTGTAQKSGDGAPVSTLPATTLPSGSVQGTVLVTGTLTPGQTQVPPANLAVIFQAERDAITGIVTVTFSGGEGQNGVQDVLFRLTRSDGQVLQKSFTLTRIGKSESLQGTKMTDRVEVIATYYNGNQYKILDQTFEYKKR